MQTVAELSKKTGIKERVLLEIRTFAARYGVEKVILFGSRARGDFRERSDIDLAFTGGDGARFSLDVEEETWTLLMFDIVNLDKPVQPELLDSIRREGIVIYDAEDEIMNLERVRDNLRARGFRAEIFDDGKAVSEYLNAAVDGTAVGFGGSVTLKELGLYDTLSAHNDVHWHWAGGAEERDRAMNTEVYLSSVNAMTEGGELLNIDGTGNRVAATLYGHKRVYFVVGQNKIAPDYEQALWRARNIAAPKNAQRLGMKTPCALLADHCYDCRSPERICRGLVVLWGPMMGTETEVLLVRENLGL